MNSDDENFDEEIEDIPKKIYKKKKRKHSHSSSDSYNLEGEVIKNKKKKKKSEKKSKKKKNKKNKDIKDSSSYSDSDSESDSFSSSSSFSYSYSSISSSSSSSESESESPKKVINKKNTESKNNKKKKTKKTNKAKNNCLNNYEDDVDWNLYQTQEIYNPIKGHTNFYMDRVEGERPKNKNFRFKNPDNMPFPSDPTPYDCFSLFFTDHLWKYIADQTNLYAAQKRKVLNNNKNTNNKKISNIAKLTAWRDITINDIKLVNAIYLWSGMLSNAQMEDNWSKRLLFQTNYGLVIKRTKFAMINCFLHLNNNEKPDKTDKLFKIRPVIAYLNSKFMKYYEMGNSLSIDEGMIKFNGLVSFKQYIKIKPVKYGVKAFLISDSFNYYCHKILIYSGNIKNEFAKNSIPEECKDFSVTEQLVLFLCNEVFGHNRIVYMDNYYTTVRLAKYFTSKNTGLIGTIRRNRIKIDKNSPLPERHGQYTFFINKEKDMTLVIYNDKSLVYMLSNVEIPKILEPKKKTSTRRVFGKPNCILDYNMGARGVDFCNRRTTKYRYSHKIFKWWKACYLHLLHLAVSNAYTIYSEFKNKDLKEEKKPKRLLHHI